MHAFANFNMSLGLSLYFTKTKTHRLSGETYIYYTQKQNAQGRLNSFYDRGTKFTKQWPELLVNGWILLFYHPVLIYCQSHDLISFLSAMPFLFPFHLHRRTKNKILKINMLLNPELIFSHCCLLFPYFTNSHILFLNGS